MLPKLKEHCVVRLKNGKEATVLSVHDIPHLPLTYLMELDETPEGMMVEIPHEAIAERLWEPPTE